VLEVKKYLPGVGIWVSMISLILSAILPGPYCLTKLLRVALSAFGPYQGRSKRSTDLVAFPRSRRRGTLLQFKEPPEWGLV
jgi:hypothetical protein